jgi:molybdate transport system ATP-binding protein
MLHCRVTKTLNGFRLDAGLSAEQGEIVAIVGPNGAGKTTLLRILAGLEDPDSGFVEVDDVCWADVAAGTLLSAEVRKVGYVPQGALLFPHLSVRKNVAFGLPRHRSDTADVWLDRMGLGEVADRLPRELSGGQAQLVALARANAPDPRVLLLDEPLASVDVANRSAVRRILLRELRTAHGYRVIVTHDPFEAAALADRLVVLEAGGVIQTGTVDDLRSRPRSPYVAELVGVNLFRGVAVAGRVRITPGFELVSSARLDGPVLASVHPRAVALYQERPSGSPRNVWRARVVAVEPSLDQLRVRVEGPIAVVAEVTREGGRSFPEGSEVWVSVKASEVAAYPE